MDGLDKAILKLLEKNARVTASEISGEINLSVSAVAERLRKLENSGIIMQYTILIDPKYINKHLKAHMSVALEGPQFTDGFVAFIETEDEILECDYLAGEFDYSLKILTEDTDSLKRILDRVKGVKGVTKTKTTVTLSNVKNKHSILPK